MSGTLESRNVPHAALKPCPAPHCAELTRGGYCAIHAQARRQQDYQLRGSAQQRGYTYRWNQISHAHLEQYPLCGQKATNAYDGWRGECYEQHRITPADVTDHIIPHKGNAELFNDPRNLQSLCSTCNRVKAIRFEGGFGKSSKGTSC